MEIDGNSARRRGGRRSKRELAGSDKKEGSLQTAGTGDDGPKPVFSVTRFFDKESLARNAETGS